MKREAALLPADAQARSFSRTSRNLLVVGHPRNRLGVAATTVEAAITHVIDAVRRYASVQGAGLRVLTGVDDGVESLTLHAARAAGLPVHLIAACAAAGALGTGMRDERVWECYIDTGGASPPPDTWTAAVDEARLSLADAMIVVWDGALPTGTDRALVSLLVEGARRNTPIVWIDSAPASDCAKRVLDPGQLSLTTLALLQADECDPVLVKALFSATADFEKSLDAVLDNAWNTTELQALADFMRLGHVDPQGTPVLSGVLHSNFFATFGHWTRRRRSPIRPHRGPAVFVNESRLPPEVWQAFDRMDRGATHAANKYRDSIVLIHLLASLAVLGAVAGAIDWMNFGPMLWGAFELLMLGAIGAVLRRDRLLPLSQHRVWLTLRQAAEALRMSALLHPHLASLPQLHREIWRHFEERKPPKTGQFVLEKPRQPVLDKPHRWLIVQLLREAGPPTHATGEPWILSRLRVPLLGQINALLDNQILFHAASHERHHVTHRRLHRLTQCVFLCVVAVVLVHLVALVTEVLGHWTTIVPAAAREWAEVVHEQSWLLLVTAFFPALTAALHGILSTLELERIAKRSQKMQQQLNALKSATGKLGGGTSPVDALALRTLAVLTADTMYREHDAWAELMKSRRLDTPA